MSAKKELPPKPVHPRKGLSTVAKYSSAPSSGNNKKKKIPTKAWLKERTIINAKYKADMKEHWMKVREWSKACRGNN